MIKEKSLKFDPSTQGIPEVRTVQGHSALTAKDKLLVAAKCYRISV